ncbi:hypothetical protein HPT25_19580 [Bacillus sp. BRMEA1]|uniref:hypothetical protein n=1 Tax=Neobacillus endophyticus TaxID=2738405 RepID=UPI00156307E5|nr:hypothetical protein [Neobacillus endophyticus]NRD79565.1 hypothetical protein [Neobacillus endophyticus]
MTRMTKTLIFVEVLIGILFLFYEFFTGQPWASDGVPWTMEGNFHFNIALGFFTAAGFTLILGGVIGSIGRRNHSKE